MKKRVLSLILALVMLIGVLPVNVLASGSADELPAQQTVTIETSLDSALADGVYPAAQSPLAVSIRAEADGEAVEHTASLDGEALTGTQAADGWTAYELSFEAAGSYTLTVSAAGETQSRTIVYQPQSADEPAAEDPAEKLPANDPELTPDEETPAEETDRNTASPTESARSGQRDRYGPRDRGEQHGGYRCCRFRLRDLGSRCGKVAWEARRQGGHTLRELHSDDLHHGCGQGLYHDRL